MNLALISHDPATGRITIHELPTTAVVEPGSRDHDERMWNTEVTVRLSNGTTMFDADPGHAIMEILGLFAEDGGVPRWKRRAAGTPTPERDRAFLNPESQAREGLG